MSQIKASDLFVKCLEEEGVTHIFGVPGEENADFMISLKKSKKIEFVLCRHEQAAAFMADLYGRLTGKAGVCLGTLGPGATNLVTGVADANMDRAPLVAIIGQAGTYRLHKESHQNMDAIAMFRPITKWAQTIYNAGTVAEVVRKAFKVAEAEKPGATVIELPEDVAKHMVDVQPLAPKKTRRAAADHKAVSQAVDIIAAAKNPVILAGNGCVRKRASEQLRRLAHKTGIPVVNTFMGKGAVSMDDEHCLFTLGLQGRDHVNLLLDEADVIVAAGYDLVEYAPAFWMKGKKKKVIVIDFEHAEVDSALPVDVDMVADVADSLWQMNELINERYEGSLPLFDIKKHAQLRKTIWEDLNAEANDNSFPVKPQRVINEMRRIMGPSDVMLSDVGAHKMWVSRYYQCYEPNTCQISNGFCTMGFALPGAIGAKIAMPNSKVGCIAGDAGFMMNVQDIETAVRNKIPFVCVVFCDEEYGLIKWKQQNQFDEHSDLKFTNPDFEKLAEAFGCYGKVVRKTEDLPSILEEAFAQEGPAIVAVPIDYSENLKLTKRLGAIEATI
ncbi:MAG: acetolactate synthase large subunit [Rhodospirillales bacterium]